MLLKPKSPALNQRKGYTLPAIYFRWSTVTTLRALMEPPANAPLVGVAINTSEPGAPMPSEVADGRPIWIRYVSLLFALAGTLKAYPPTITLPSPPRNMVSWAME